MNYPFSLSLAFFFCHIHIPEILATPEIIPNALFPQPCGYFYSKYSLGGCFSVWSMMIRQLTICLSKMPETDSLISLSKSE